MLSPADVVVQADRGFGDMGDVTDSDTGTRARFGLDEPYVLVFIRATVDRVSGSAGSDTAASLYLKVDSGRLGGDDPSLMLTGPYDHTLYEFENFGPADTTSVNFRLTVDERTGWLFQAGDRLVLEWTNPDATDVYWGIEVGLAPASADQ